MMQASRATRHLRRVLTVIALGFLAALFLPQTPQARAVEPRANVTLVSNFGVGNSLVGQTSVGWAQRFTTGPSAAGYRLSDVLVQFQSGGEFNLSVCAVQANNTPTDTCWNFTAPSSFDENSNLTFTAPSNANLAAGTSYSVVLKPKVASTEFGFQMTSGNGEDSGGAAGWSIADGSHLLSGTNWNSQANKVRIRVRGAVLNTDPTFDENPPVTREINENVAGVTSVGLPVSASDGDNDTLHYSLGGTDASSFTIVSTSGQIQTKSGTTYNHESKDSYTVTVNVRDNKDEDGDTDSANDASIAVTVDVVDLDEPATVTFSPSSGPYKEGDQITATVTDQDDGFSVDSYQWARGTTLGGSFADITGATSAAYTPTEDDIDNYLRFTVQYDDSHSDDKHVSLTTGSKVVVGNTDPEFSSNMVSRSVAENTAANVNVGAPVSTTDDDGDTLEYRLTGTDAASFGIDAASGQIKTSASLNFESRSSYSVVVEVRDKKDDTGASDTAWDDTIAVTINLSNVDEAGSVTLPGTITGGQAATATLTDPDGTTSSESWEWSISDMANGTFTVISGATSNPYTPVAADVGKYLKATASYSDVLGSGKSATSAASSQVAAGNVDPYFSSMTATRSVPENSGSGAYIGDPVSGTDDDGDTLIYSLSGTDASYFIIFDQTGQIATKSGITYDYEATSTYSVILSVRDNKDEAGDPDTVTDDSINVTINLINVDEAGTVTISGMELGGETLTASVTDIDGTVSSLSWQWARGASASGPFAPISGATNSTYTTVATDVNRFVRATASYTDPQGSGKSANAATGQIAARNNEPTFDDGTLATREVVENSGGGTNVGSAVAATDGDGDSMTYSFGTGGDESSFTINSGTGQIKTKSGIAYNYEGDAQYGVTVRVRDSKDSAGNSNTGIDDTISVIISLTDVNETPAISTTQTTISVAENQTSVLDYDATDVDDNGETNDSDNVLTWSVESADDGSFFEINSSSGVLTFKNAPNFENRQDAGADNIYNVTVTVTDNGIDGDRGASNHLSISKSLAVTVTDVNETPTLTTAPNSATFDENATGVVATYVATDPDVTTGTMSWDLQGNDAGDFNIASTVNGTAELTFKRSPDYERPDDTGSNNVYDVTVRVRDNGSPRLEDTQTVAITVNDLNETPVIAGDAAPDFAEIEFDHTATASELVIGTYTATDDDNADNAGLQTITFDVTGADAAHFSIDGTTGVLSFSIEPDFENPADLADSNMMGASDNMYEIVVEADDGAGESNSVGTFGVTVTVTNVNETPEIPAGVPGESFAEIEWDADSADLDVMTYIPRDEETSTLTALSWSLSGTDADDFQITEDSTNGHGTLSFRDRPNYEDPTDRVNTSESHAADDNMYQVIVKISDGPNTREYPMTVTVTNVNETPGFTHSIHPTSAWNADEIEYDSGTTANDMSTIPATVANQAYWYRFEARDEEGDDIIWTITGPDAVDFVIDEDPDFVMTADADESAIARWNIVPDYENPMGLSPDVVDHGYVFTVNASDGTNTAIHNVFVRIDDVNERPEFTGTIETAIALDEHNSELDMDGNETPYTLAPIATYTGRDEEGGVRWSLTGTDAGDFEIDSGGNVTFKETPSFEDPKDSGGDNVYEFTVVVTDRLSKSNRRTAMQPVTVTVQDIEEEGHVAIAEGDESPGVDDTVTFELTDPDGEIDVDRAGDPKWQVQRGSPGSWSTISTVITGASSYGYTVQEADANNQLRVVVTYKDRRGEDKMATSAPTDVVTVDPRANVPPRLRSGVFTTSEGPAIIDFGTLDATDRDGDRITFAMLEQQDHALFELSAAGRLRAIQALDFEAGDTLSITITLSDGKGLDSSNNEINDDSVDITAGISIILFDVEEEGVITFSPQEPEAGAPQTATLADSDGGITGRTWQWARSQDGRSNWSNIPSATGSSYTPTVNDEDFYLRATVTYTDRRGSGKRAEAITGPVPSENRRPLFPSTETGQRSVAENTRSGQNIGAAVAAEDPEQDRMTYSLTGTDAAYFTIVTSTGQIRVKDALDFETKSTYSVTVNVHDGKDGTGTTSTTIDDTQNVTITVENLEEPGTVTLSSETATIQARVPVTATLEDDDDPTNVSWQWARSRSSTSGWANIAGATSATFTPEDTDIGGYIRATANYSDGEGSGKTATKVSPRVGQAPPVNSAPAFPATENGRREIAEDATGGTAVGDPVVANDFNNDTLTYSLSGTDAALFTIGTNDGQLRVATGAQLDFETKRTLRVTVEVTDGANSLGDTDGDAIDDRQNVTITLTDVNEAPVVTGDGSPSVVENLNRAVATYTGTDPERDALTWSVSGSTFWISQRGQLHFATPPSYEDGTNYSVTITSEDEEGLSGSLFVSVTVTDLEEAGVVTIEPKRGWDGTTFTAELVDDDTVVGSVGWQWQRSSNRSSWGDISGATSSSYTAGADDINQYLRAVATYEDDRGSGKSAQSAATGRIGDSTNQPATNIAPQFADTTAERSVGQGTAAGRNIGAPVQATDVDSDDILTYSLGGSDAGLFGIDPATGQLKTRAILDYDPDGTNTYEVQVRVHDGFTSSYVPSTSVDATITVTITVTRVVQRITRGGGGGGGSNGAGGGGGGGGGGTRVNQKPEIDGLDSVTFKENSSGRVASYTAADPDGNNVSWEIDGLDSDAFEIDQQGELTFKASPDFESPTDFEGDNTYQLRLLVTDDGSPSLADALNVRVRVTNVNELGAVTGEAQVSVNENFTGQIATYKVQDPEGDSIVWSLSGLDASVFEIDQQGRLSVTDTLDFETPSSSAGTNVHSLTVIASDDGRPPISSEIQVSVTVSNVNETPVAIETSTVDLTEGDAPTELDLGELFSDPEGGALAYELSGQVNPDVLSVSVADSTASITPVGAGESSFEVIAYDPEGLTGTTTVDVLVARSEGVPDRPVCSWAGNLLSKIETKNSNNESNPISLYVWIEDVLNVWRDLACN